MWCNGGKKNILQFFYVHRIFLNELNTCVELNENFFSADGLNCKKGIFKQKHNKVILNNYSLTVTNFEFLLLYYHSRTKPTHFAEQHLNWSNMCKKNLKKNRNKNRGVSLPTINVTVNEWQLNWRMKTLKTFSGFKMFLFLSMQI